MRYSLTILLVCALTACSPTPPPTRAGTLERDRTLIHDGKTRRYHLYTSAAPSPRPLVLLLHGGGALIDNHIGLGAARWPHQVWLDIADEEDLHLLIPQGVARHWNDCRRECERCGEEDDVGFLMKLLDEVASRHNVDANKIYVVGESNGGFMTERLAQEAPHRFAAVGVVIALMPKNNSCSPSLSPMPVMYQVGDDDAAIPYKGGSNDPNVAVLSARETIAYWSALNGCDGDATRTPFGDLDPQDGSVAYRDDYRCSSAPLSFITMENAGHVPPSKEVYVSGVWEGIAGVQNHDFEGARTFWSFFKNQSRAQ